MSRNKPAVGIRKPNKPTPADMDAFVNGDTKAVDVASQPEEPAHAKPKASKPIRRTPQQGTTETGVVERVSRAKRRRFTIYFDDFELAEKVRVESVLRGVEMSKLFEEAVRKHLKS